MTFSEFVSAETGWNRYFYGPRMTQRMAERYSGCVTPKMALTLTARFLMGGGDPELCNPRDLIALGYRTVWVKA
jgi:hypothetical protein